MEILLWIGGLVLFAILVSLFFYIRHSLRVMARKRHRWALAVGMPARIAAMETRTRDKEMNAPDPEYHLSVCNFQDDRDWLFDEAVAQGHALAEGPDESQRRARQRIKSRLQCRSARAMIHHPIKGYSAFDAIAWDSASLVEEVRLSVTLGWMPEEEAWGLIFLNARRVQDSFESWTQFSEAAMRGREYELLYARGLHAGQSVKTAVARYLNAKESSFSRLPWREELVLTADDFKTKPA